MLVATAMRDGAKDFLVKPLDLPQLRHILHIAFDDPGGGPRRRSA
jgi:FixJ family two-component response regulator